MNTTILVVVLFAVFIGAYSSPIYSRITVTFGVKTELSTFTKTLNNGDDNRCMNLPAVDLVDYTGRSVTEGSSSAATCITFYKDSDCGGAYQHFYTTSPSADMVAFGLVKSYRRCADVTPLAPGFEK